MWISGGGTQTYTISPYEGYAIEDVKVDGVSMGAIASYTFSDISADHTISATFVVQQAGAYTITATAGPGGALNPIGVVMLNSGGSQEYIIQANTQYYIVDVIVDGISVGAVSSYIFSNVTANHSISATFGNKRFVELRPVADTYINLNSVNYSSSAELNAGTWPAGLIANSILMKFDLSSIPAGARIENAILNLYQVNSDNNAANPNYNLSLRRIINFNPDLALATGYTYDGVNSWTPIVDCCHDGIPMGQADITASYNTVAADQTVGLKFWDATQLVKDWMANPTSNYGLMINADTAAPADTFRTFASSEYPDSMYAPTMLVMYGATDQFTITSTSSFGGSITPLGEVNVPGGSSQTYTFTPEPGYVILGVFVDGVYQGAVNSYTFSNITANHLIDVCFTEQRLYSINVTKMGTGTGTITVSPSTSVPAGTVVTLTATPDAGSIFSGWMGDYTFSGQTVVGSMPAKDMNIYAEFNKSNYTITSLASSGGSISPAGATVVPHGFTQAYTFTPNPGYKVDSVSVDGADLGAWQSYTFQNVTSDHIIAVIFKPATYMLVSGAGTGGTISPGPETPVFYGMSQTFTITPNTGYSIDAVYVDGVSVGAVSSYTFSNISTYHTIYATFKLRTYTIQSSAGAGGAISPAGATIVNSGGTQTYTITPAACYSISDVVVNGVSVGAVSSYTFSNVTANQTIAAVFSLKSYTIASSAGTGGSISPAGSGSINCGSSQTYTITPSAGYSIADMIVDGISQGALGSYTFSNVSANHTIAATFSLNTFTVTASAGTGGSISPSGVSSVNYGGNITYTIAPSLGYKVAGVLINGVSVGAMTSYTFSNVTQNQTISVTFATAPVYTITASAGAGGVISPFGKVKVTKGAGQTFTITPKAGYKIYRVKVDGKSVGAVSSYTFSNITKNRTISASFTRLSTDDDD